MTVHIPVLPDEIIHLGRPQLGQTWLDGTAGGGGHTRLLSAAVGQDGRVIAFDRDPIACEQLGDSLPPNCSLVNESYEQIPAVLEELAVSRVDGILLDLGLSSDQLHDRERGFSFQTDDAELDMRFDMSSGEPAWQWLAREKETTIADAIYQYGEERFSRRIAKRIVEQRRRAPIRKVGELRELIYQATPSARRVAGKRRHGRVDPATRTFQALRIVVNDELGILERAMRTLPAMLATDGRLLAISFHSLEDRIVKYAFRGDDRLQIETKKPVQATEEEVISNPRSRSAKLRVARRLPDSPSPPTAPAAVG